MYYISTKSLSLKKCTQIKQCGKL